MSLPPNQIIELLRRLRQSPDATAVAMPDPSLPGAEQTEQKSAADMLLEQAVFKGLVGHDPTGFDLMAGALPGPTDPFTRLREKVMAHDAALSARDKARVRRVRGGGGNP